MQIMCKWHDQDIQKGIRLSEGHLIARLHVDKSTGFGADFAGWVLVNTLTGSAEKPMHSSSLARLLDKKGLIPEQLENLMKQSAHRKERLAKLSNVEGDLWIY